MLDDSILASSEFEYLRILGALHPNIAHVYDIVALFAQELDGTRRNTRARDEFHFTGTGSSTMRSSAASAA